MRPWRLLLAILTLACSFANARGENGHNAWLRYERLPEASIARIADRLPAAIVTVTDSPIARAAVDEIVRGVRGMTGIELRVAEKLPDEPAIVVGTVLDAGFVAGERTDDALTPPATARDGYHVFFRQRDGQDRLWVVGTNDRSALYGAFVLLRALATGRPLAELDERSFAAAPLRVINHWDNLDGTIERGYAGPSIFWENEHVTKDLQGVSDYGRLLASLGINGCSINNVNADVRVITPEYLTEVAQIAAAFRPWGVRVYLSLNFAAPRDVGGIDTFDPLDPKAVAFWREAVDRVYEAVPDLGGFVLKADSEGRLGPAEYGRTPADAANVIARAAKPHGGVLFYRGFVYNHLMDWRDLKNDRATAAYNNFHKLDGLFDDNVVVQIKHGPIDFQVREPASPLFSGLERTNQAIELQVTQEYLGQQKHLCYVAPMWKEVLDFDMQAGPPEAPSGTPVKELVAGRTFKRSLGGFVGVANVGRDANWLRHPLAMANLYAFGRLAWDPNLSSEQIAEEWTRQTFGPDAAMIRTITDLLNRSWHVYEQYTGNLGIGTLTDIIHIHFGPAPESSEYNGWGQWHRADEHGVGMDRTVATGTGCTAQYRPPVAAMFESLASCPEKLLLFMHHVPYTHRLKSGKTVIQHFYDEHYTGADAAAGFVDAWRSLNGRIDHERYNQTLALLEFQAGHAQVWRDAICRYFLKRSGIADEQGRVGTYPGRYEAEDAKLEGYTTFDVTPWEAASGSRGAELPVDVERGAVTFVVNQPAGKYDVRLQYFDEEDGVSRFEVWRGEQRLDAWHADGHVPTPTTEPDAHSSTRRTIRGVDLRPGDEIRVVGLADREERGALDYLEIVTAAD
jgi:alpha-glucuronidase